MSIYTIALLSSASLSVLFLLINNFIKNKWVQLAGVVSLGAWIGTITYLFYMFVNFTVSMIQQIVFHMMSGAR